MEKIRILHCLQNIGSGGVERRRLSMAKLLSKEKYVQKIICTAVTGDFYKEFEKEGVEIIPVGHLKSPFQFSIHKKVCKIINSYKPHIIHGAVFEGVLMAAIDGCIKNVPIIILEETSDPLNRSWKANYLLRALTFCADKVIGVSKASTDYLEIKAKVNKIKIQLINNGVALPRNVRPKETKKLKQKLNIEEGEIIIGSIGRMINDNHKRFSDLIKSFNLLLKKGTVAKLVLVGEGPELTVYRKLANSLAISDKIIFTGYQDDVALYYSIFDIFALFSATEAFGLVLAEAMLCKLPIVATRVGGMQFIVEDQKTGYLVPKFNVEEMAKRLKQLVNNDTLRKEYGIAGYRRALKNYTEDIYIQNIDSLYLELLKKKQIF